MDRFFGTSGRMGSRTAVRMPTMAQSCEDKATAGDSSSPDSSKSYFHPDLLRMKPQLPEHLARIGPGRPAQKNFRRLSIRPGPTRRSGNPTIATAISQ